MVNSQVEAPINEVKGGNYLQGLMKRYASPNKKFDIVRQASPKNGRVPQQQSAKNKGASPIRNNDKIQTNVNATTKANQTSFLRNFTNQTNQQISSNKINHSHTNSLLQKKHQQKPSSIIDETQKRIMKINHQNPALMNEDEQQQVQQNKPLISDVAKAIQNIKNKAKEQLKTTSKVNQQISKDLREIRRQGSPVNTKSKNDTIQANFSKNNFIRNKSLDKINPVYETQKQTQNNQQPINLRGMTSQERRQKKISIIPELEDWDNYDSVKSVDKTQRNQFQTDCKQDSAYQTDKMRDLSERRKKVEENLKRILEKQDQTPVASNTMKLLDKFNSKQNSQREEESEVNRNFQMKKSSSSSKFVLDKSYDCNRRQSGKHLKSMSRQQQTFNTQNLFDDLYEEQQQTSNQPSHRFNKNPVLESSQSIFIQFKTDGGRFVSSLYSEKKLKQQEDQRRMQNMNRSDFQYSMNDDLVKIESSQASIIIDDSQDINDLSCVNFGKNNMPQTTRVQQKQQSPIKQSSGRSLGRLIDNYGLREEEDSNVKLRIIRGSPRQVKQVLKSPQREGNAKHNLVMNKIIEVSNKSRERSKSNKHKINKNQY
eukprot:403340912